MRRQESAEQLSGDSGHFHSRLNQEQCLDDLRRHAEILAAKTTAVHATKNTGDYSEEHVSGRNRNIARAG